MMKILVMIPAAGEVYNQNCVRSYYHSRPDLSIKNYYNMGDLFVYDSSLKLLDFIHVEPLKLTNCSQQDLDRYNSEFDFCFLRGSNYIHPNMQWGNAASILKKLKIPVVPFGIGAQSPENQEILISQETKEILKIMADRCVSVGVRGAYTAEILSQIGINNIDIIGCPTLFRHNNPDLQIKLPPFEEIEAVGYTLRREVSNDYSSSTLHYLQIQRDMIFDLNKKFTLTIMAQGEIEEKMIFYRFTNEISGALKNLVSVNWLKAESDPMQDIYFNQMFYSESVSGYDEIVRKLDLVLGFRLHGNLISLANGTPAIYCNYDSRTREFAETYSIPSYDIDSPENFLIEEYYQQDLFEKFNKRYKEMYFTMSEFLSKNGMSHKMKPKFNI